MRAQPCLVGEPVVERRAELAVELLEVVEVHRGDQAAAVAEVVVDERPRHAGGVGDLLEA